MNANFVRKLLKKEIGDIKPLLLPLKDLSGPTLKNPSVLVTKNEKILVNLRNINCSLYQIDIGKYSHVWSPHLTEYLNINYENNFTQHTTNYIAELDSDLNIIRFAKVDTSLFDSREYYGKYVGLEDARLIEWNDKIYLCGFRSDASPEGRGRMELSELDIDFNENNFSAKEISRLRIPGPPPDAEYCMKNCTPVEDMPFHLVKWHNPTCLMKFDSYGNNSTEVTETNHYISMPYDMRGGSQVLKFEEGYLSLVHEPFWKESDFSSEHGKVDLHYLHRFVYWTDKKFKNRKFSKSFSFLNMRIEFACGMTKYKDDFLITFGASDNLAYIIRVPQSFVYEFIMMGENNDDDN